MAVPKYKTSKSRRNQRRNHHRIDPKSIAVCSNCNHMHVYHHICDNCGFYRGKKLK